MLITCCPQCRTTFRIKAADLEQAAGHVRCGRCTSVFDAYKELRQSLDPAVTGVDQFNDDGEADPALLSVAETDQLEEQLVAKDPSASAPPSPQPTTQQTEAESASLAETPKADPETVEEDLNKVAEQFIEETVPRQPADGPHEPDEAVSSTESEPEEGEMEFDLPAEQWQDFFSDTFVEDVPTISDTGVEWVVLSEEEAEALSEAEQQTGADANQTQSEPSITTTGGHRAEDAEVDSDHEPSDQPDGAIRELKLADDQGPADEGHVMDLEALARESAAVGEESEEDLEGGDEAAVEAYVIDLEAATNKSTIGKEEPPGPEADEEPADEGHVIDLEAPAGEPAAKGAEPLEVETDLFVALDELPEERQNDRGNLWIAGAAVLFLLLAGQLLHYSRNQLAAHSTFGPMITSAYGLIGQELRGAWDLDQYQINKWVATSDADASGAPSLRITAQITNRGPKAQPHPLVHLELKDRWDETVAGRVFDPGEYLTKADAQDQLMSPGSSVQAELRVVDPGQDAYGFELDVCIRTTSDGMRCANDPLL